MVIKKTVAPPPKGGSGVCKPRTSQKESLLTIDVSITDTDVFKNFLGVISKIVMDQRMPDELRDDALLWLNDIGASAGTLVSACLTQEYIIVLCESVSLGKYHWEQIKHKYNPNSTIRFIGQSLPDGLRPDKVVLVKGYEKSRGIHVTWFTRDGEKPEVINESGKTS